jgi:regulator of cell morphogenesis and NO signaling
MMTPKRSEKIRVADWSSDRSVRSRIVGEPGIDYRLATESGDHTNGPYGEREDIIEHIETVHHTYLRKELPHLLSLIDQVHGLRHPNLPAIENAYEKLRLNLESHLKAQEHVLFPMIRQLRYTWAEALTHGGGLRRLLEKMGHEYGETERILARLRRASDDYTPPPGSRKAYIELLNGLAHLELEMYRHIHEEESILFPKALDSFADQRR